MIQRIKDLLNIKHFFNVHNFGITSLKKELIQNRLALGKILENQNRQNTALILEDIHKAEFQIFSQWGDDGIINFLIHYLNIDSKTFVEFGVENYTECNTRFLLINNNWRGLIMDGSEKNIDNIKKQNISWQYDLRAVSAFITAENINELLKKNGFEGDLGLLHIDIDGNDYWIWESIRIVKPVIVIVEYNSLFSFDKAWTIPYESSFYRGDAHYSNLYYGTSILSLCDLAKEKGYSFIGCNSNGNNAYFVRNDKLKELKVLSPEEGYVLAMFSESRDKNGKLTYLRDKNRFKILKGMKVFNTQKNEIELIQ